MELEFRLPDLGQGIAEAEIIQWHVAAGDKVSEEDLLVTIQTDKALADIPSPVEGVVMSLGADVGDVLDVGSVLCVLSTDAAVEMPAAPAAAGRAEAAPAVRKLASELGVDLGAVKGTGPDGRIVREDVLGASRPASEDEERVALSGIRKQIVRNMADAWRTVPHIYDHREVDATKLVGVHSELGVTYTAFFVRAVASALRDHPLLNSSLDLERDELVHHRRIHIGIATATEAGLMVPVIRDADRMSLEELGKAIRELSEGTRSRKLSLDQMQGATYSISNYGVFGGWLGSPIIRPPQVGILGFGSISDRVVAVDGKPVVRPTFAMSSGADHRLIDGDVLAAYTSAVAALLEEGLSR